MTQTDFRPLYRLSIVVVVLAVIASAAGLFSDLYRDNVWTASQLRGSDLVRLLVYAPAFIVALVSAIRGSKRGLLVWLGLLWTTLYDYAFYLFGAAFNELFLAYVVLFSLPILLLILALPKVDAGEMGRTFGPRTPTRAVAYYMLFVGGFLGVLWIAQTLGFVVTGELPQSIADSGHPTAVVFALDLSLLVPGMILGAILLLGQRPWGYVVAGMMIVKGAVYPLVLIGMSAFSAAYDIPGAWEMGALWAVFAVAGLSAAGLFFSNMKSQS